jgi:polysaccharide deacetylase 2 family uncharacterized protein YibQ
MTDAPTIEQQIESIKDAMVRLDVEMHNYQTRVNTALKLIVERLEHNEQRIIDIKTINPSNDPTIQGGVTVAYNSREIL